MAKAKMAKDRAKEALKHYLYTAGDIIGNPKKNIPPGLRRHPDVDIQIDAIVDDIILASIEEIKRRQEPNQPETLRGTIKALLELILGDAGAYGFGAEDVKVKKMHVAVLTSLALGRFRLEYPHDGVSDESFGTIVVDLCNRDDAFDMVDGKVSLAAQLPD